MKKKHDCTIFHSTSEAKNFLKQGSCVAIGNYDGFHFGHQAIVKSLIQKAQEKKLKSALLTFEPHPVKLLAPEVAPLLINTLKQKLELIGEYGLDAIVAQNFDQKFSKIKPEDFFKKYLINDLNAQFVTVGHDFTFGEKRSGTIETLEHLAQKNHIDVKIVEAKMLANTLVSSSLIRKLIKDGNVKLASKMLTRPFFIDGHVVQGHNRGTALGIHTANLTTENELIPSDGVYASFVRLNNKTFTSVTNIGFNPTFDNQTRSIETHILDFNQNIYDKNIRLFFIEKIREEIKFATPTALVQQIEKDIASAKKILKGTEEP